MTSPILKIIRKTAISQLRDVAEVSPEDAREIRRELLKLAEEIKRKLEKK